jgi:cytochrome c
MKSYLIAALAVASVAFAGAAQADQAMAKEKGCLGCHDIEKKKMGPAFKDVSAKYKGDAGAQATLTAKVTEGKGHPKQTKATPEEVSSLVKWVLSL